MKYCTQCGNQMEDNALFCTKCGASFGNSKGVENKPTTQKSVRKLTKKQKTLVVISIIIALAAIIFFSTGFYLNSKKRVVANFTSALTQKNTKTLEKYVVCSDPRLKIDEKSITCLMKIMDKNPNMVSQIINDINTQSNNMDTKAILKAAFNNDSNNPHIFTLKKKGKKFFFFDNYVFELKPYFIDVDTNFKGTAIYVDDKESGTSKEDGDKVKVGPLIPGEHAIKLDLKTNYADINASQDVDVVPGDDNDNIIEVTIPLKADYIKIDSNFNDAKVFLNGKNTNITVTDCDKLGPVPMDGTAKIYLSKSFPWGDSKSKEMEISDSNISLDVDADDNLKQQLMAAVNAYNLSWIQATIARDVSKINNATDDQKEKIKNDIDDMIENQRLYTGKLVKTDYDLDSVKVCFENGKYQAVISDKEYYNDSYYNEGESAPECTDNDDTWEYTLIYDESSKKWLADSSSSGYDFNSENVKSFTY